jgi:hypothetical protein
MADGQVLEFPLEAVTIGGLTVEKVKDLIKGLPGLLSISGMDVTAPPRTKGAGAAVSESTMVVEAPGAYSQVKRYRQRAADDLQRLRVEADRLDVTAQLLQVLDGDIALATAMRSEARRLMTAWPEIAPGKGRAMQSSFRHRFRSESARKIVAAALKSRGWGDYDRLAAVKWIVSSLKTD